jgi:cell division protein FtsL
MAVRNQPRRDASEETKLELRQRHWLLLGLVVVVALSLVYLWQSWRWISAYNELQEVRAQLEATEAERERLRFRVERAFSLERVERIAREQLDMTRPEPRYLELVPSDSDPP